jgi:penicillin-binding protein 1C
MLLSYIIQRKRLKQAVIFAGVLSWLMLILNFLFPIKVHKPYSTLIYSQEKELIGAFLSSDDKWRMELQPSEISPELKKANGSTGILDLILYLW